MNSMIGKVAVVTGGSRGIGKAIVEALVGEGVHTAFCSRNETESHSVAATIAEQHKIRVLGYGCDVRHYVEVKNFFESVISELGGVDILINNAGVGIFRTLDKLVPEEWRTVIETNLNGVYYCCYEAIPSMKQRGEGYIINIGSLAGRNAFRGGTAYNASKFGLNGFSEALMQDVRYDGIRVSTVMPGSVKTDFGGNVPGPEDDWKTRPSDVASVVLHLLKHPSRSLPSRVEMRPSQPPQKG